MQKNRARSFLLFLIIFGLSACTAPAPAATAQPTHSPTPTAIPVCAQPGTIGFDHVPHPTQGYELSFEYYLPPCYESLAGRSYPVLYLMTLTFETRLSATDNTPISLADRLIHNGKLPAAILIVPDPPVGYGTDAAMTKDLVPYVDGKFRTLRDRLHRGVGGASHGAGIAVRMAFQFPETFGSVGLLSGGLADGEQERFSGWVTRVSPALWPRVRIDVGDQDSILSLTHILTGILDKYQVPYTLNVVPGGTHSFTFWSTRMQSYLLWFSQPWQ